MNRKAQKWLRLRVALLSVIFCVLFVGLLSRAAHLQIICGQALKDLGDRQHTRNLEVCPERKKIVDRNGQTLAATVLADSIYADPSKVKDPGKAAAQLSNVIGVDRSRIHKALSQRANFCWIARQVSPEGKNRVVKLDLEGIYTVSEPKRFYPHRELACHVLGFAGVDSSGLEGLELQYDRYLKGAPRSVLWGRDAKGNAIYRAGDGVGGRDGGTDLVLTIDGKIQHIAELELQEAALRTGAKSGSVVVMDIKTGEVLAMANIPSYNLNTFKDCTADVRRNRAVTDTFEPGSVFKPFVFAAALEEGVISEHDIIDCENGVYFVGGRTISEAQRKKYDKLTAAEVIKYSSNIGIAKIAAKVGRDRLHEYITSFGFGSKTGIDLPGEVGGILREPGEWRPVDFAALSFGQCLSVTAVQLAAAMSAIANDGVLMKPFIVKATVADGKVMKEFSPTPLRRVVSPRTARRVTAVLKEVVESNDGTGRAARLSIVPVAGKTGTSQKFDFSQGRYSTSKVVTSFVGFFPADDPRMTVLVVLDEPQKERWGGMAAAPVFKGISEHILTCFNRDIDLSRMAEEGGVEPEMLIKPASMFSSPVIGAMDPVINTSSEVPVFDFTGLSMRDVLKAGKELGIDIRVSGSGWAVSQTVHAPAVPGDRPRCYVSFSSDIR